MKINVDLFAWLSRKCCFLKKHKKAIYIIVFVLDPVVIAGISIDVLIVISVAVIIFLSTKPRTSIEENM